MQVKLRAGNQFQKLSTSSSMADSLVLFFIFEPSVQRRNGGREHLSYMLSRPRKPSLPSETQQMLGPLLRFGYMAFTGYLNSFLCCAAIFQSPGLCFFERYPFMHHVALYTSFGVW